MVRWFRWVNRHGLLPGLALLLLSVVVIAHDLLAFRSREPEPQQPNPTGPAPVPQWEEPLTVPIEEVERGGLDRCWVVVRGVVTPDGADGLNWVGISGDGQQTRVALVFHKRDFRRCQVGQVVTVEGYQRGSLRGVA
jgi:hypothetical protein